MKNTNKKKSLFNKAGIAFVSILYSFIISCSNVDPLLQTLNNQVSTQNNSATGNFFLSPLGQKVYERIIDEKFTKEINSTIPKTHYLTFGNKFIRTLVDGTQIFPGFKEAISKAEQEVKLVTFEWNDKTDASRLIGEGLKLAEQNVPQNKKLKVKIIADQVKVQGNMVIRALLNSKKNWNLDPDKIDLQLAVYPHSGLGAMHTKYLLVDGKEIIITGANVQDVHNFTPNIWHDTGYYIKGPAGNTILKDFENAWTKHSDYITCSNPNDIKDCAVQETPPLDDPQIENPPFLDGFPVISMTKTSKEFLNNDIDNPLDQGWLAAMENARSYINIETPNINASAFQDAVIAAAKRGVLVKIISGKGMNDISEGLPSQGGTNATIVKKLHTRMANEAYDLRGKLQLRWYSKNGKYPVEGGTANASHTKYMSVDGKITIIGSGNMDTQTWKQSREFNFLLDNQEITGNIEKAFFNGDWQRATQIPY